MKWLKWVQPPKKKEDLTVTVVMIALLQVLMEKKIITEDEIYKKAMRVKRDTKS